MWVDPQASSGGVRGVGGCRCGVADAFAWQGRPLERLTGRERQVLLLLGGGASNRAIGRRLGIGERTVKKHLTSILAKTGVSSRLAAALLAQHRHAELCPYAGGVASEGVPEGHRP
ncbi:LuxR family transcriptional regulator [Streptomyces vinaceus]|uniref:LuxR family transcriptional regulator n=1 Tax=Streptomyces vinaceus TaxID=1960 RepID=A0A5J6JI67_STRVI|nr:helix-turn-helix transcriptional regulator [Streptomyces vinaceus]QEV49511.1 LuxR family transcriptional regulator [Streptomyces vinaceus]